MKPRFEVNIDGQIYNDQWWDLSGAVMGALRRHENKLRKVYYQQWEKDHPGKNYWEIQHPPLKLDDVAIIVKRLEE